MRHMDIFSLFAFAGGLGLFLFGMNVLGEAIRRQAGGKMKSALERIVSSRIMAVLLGAGVTAVIQSSGATTVMIVGFINSGIMSLEGAAGLIYGANIGTTATGWLLALNSISGESTLLRLLNPDSFVPVLAFAGAILLVFTHSDSLKDLGSILLGFSVLMFGMDAMSEAMEPLRTAPAFQRILVALDHPLPGILAGFVMAAVLQSSSAAVGIVQAAAVTGVITVGNALPLVMGQNIGAGLIVLFAGTGSNRDARRAAWVYMLQNLFSMVIFLIPLLLVRALTDGAFLRVPINAVQIALLHTCYKTAGAMVQLPFTKHILRLTGILVKKQPEEEKFALLDENFLKTPPVAVARCKELTEEMAGLAAEALAKAIETLRVFDAGTAREVRQLEQRIDSYEDKIGNYLFKLSSSRLSAADSREVSKLLHGISDFERLSDHARNVMESAEELKTKGLSFTPDSMQELEVLFSAVEESAALAVSAFVREDDVPARHIESLEEVVDELCEELRRRHIDRLKAGEYSVTFGFILTDILTNLERASDHCDNIAMSVLQLGHAEYEPHVYEARLKAGDPEFRRYYKEYARKYRLRAASSPAARAEA